MDVVTLIGSGFKTGPLAIGRVMDSSLADLSKCQSSKVIIIIHLTLEE